jgi:hypothetical protein
MPAAQIEAAYVRHRTDRCLPQRENKCNDLGGLAGAARDEQGVARLTRQL